MIWGFVDYENIGSLKDIDFLTYQKNGQNVQEDHTEDGSETTI